MDGERRRPLVPISCSFSWSSQMPPPVPPHGKGGADDDRVADAVRTGQRILQGLHDFRGMMGWRSFSIVSLNSSRSSARSMVSGSAGQQADAGAVQIAGTGQLHGQVQAHLAAEVGQDGVGLLISRMRSTTSRVMGSMYT